MPEENDPPEPPPPPEQPTAGDGAASGDPGALPTQVWTGPAAAPAPPASRPTIPASPPNPHARRGGWQAPMPAELQPSFPQYEIIGFLGRGGMGAVYKGWQKSLHRFVAIKILPPQLEDNEAGFVERFQREARAMARFTHLNIVAVHDAGETAEGLLYFVMEYVEGTDVQKLVAAEGKLTPAHAVAISAHVCDALAYAHQRNVIHRDIKPSNIMVDAEGQVKVADFGLAKVSADSAVEAVTGSHVSMGTPDFMAPEALLGMAHVDHRADLYAVGVMLYQMLTGELPRGLFEMPSAQTPGLDPRFDAIVSRALQKNPDKRYASATELRTDLDRLQTQPIPHVADATAAAPPGKSRWPVFAGIAAAAVIVVLIAVVVAPKSPTSGNDDGIGSPATAPPAGSDGRAGARPSEATKDAPFVNTLGMKFVPVPILGGPTGGQRVLFSVWDTRVLDYEEFVKETKREWQKPEFEQGPTHPAVNVGWEDAQLFCRWLTGREQAAGRLPADWSYRLPSDHEWSCAVGIGAREDPAKLPSEKSGKVNDAFPWGTQWPPPEKAGNYASEELRPLQTAGKFTEIKIGISGFHDGYANTSPVGSYAANSFGLYDLGGNVWQWCQDWFDKDQKERVLRGASWHYVDRGRLLSSYRGRYALADRNSDGGFRCVLAVASSPLPVVSPVAPATALPPGSDGRAGTRPSEATKDAPFVNTLGMQFAPVPILGGPTGGQRVLFSVWDTRVQDYQEFVKDTKCEWPKVDFEQGPTHPAVMVSWEDAQLFCQWLTGQEQAAGRLPAEWSYRLPSDHEWSCAVGIGAREDPAKLPSERSGTMNDAFPWGTQWPPPEKAGNYASEELRPLQAAGKFTQIKEMIPGYHDGYANTSPVGSYAENSFGLYDMGGNVFQWCQDWLDKEQTTRVLRGAAWDHAARGYLRSSSRYSFAPTTSSNNCGFRCVLAPASAPQPAAAKVD